MRTVRAEPTAAGELPGLGAEPGRLDALLVRGGAHWVVARDGAAVTAARVSADPGAVFDLHRVRPVPGQGYVTPVPGGGLAVSGGDAVTLQDADGSVRWTFPHLPWPAGASGACAPEPSGAGLLAVVPPADPTARGELLVVLDLATGTPLARTPLPTHWGTYAFQHRLGPPAAHSVLLDAAQGQEEAYSLLASRAGVAQVGGWDEPFTGGSDPTGGFLTLAVGGERLTRYDASARAATAVDAADVLPDGLVFTGRPGFLDARRVLAPAGEDPWEDACRHLLLDAGDLRPRARIAYPPDVGEVSRALPLGDGTWLTLHGDTVRRWRTPVTAPDPSGPDPSGPEPEETP
ncbi:hypothetical protein ACFVU3_04505 [Streptomyces sp. NPDC058052]|uniref:hypothetical protein n=1 Tax=Streptomyces sp. NPDC058052 TaxID=3346316 RepID=UPI0036E555E2